MKAKLIVIEGLDATGKETQSKKLVQKLSESGIKSTYISFPNYNSSSSYFVKMYLNGEISDDPNNINEYASSCFFAMDRYISFKKEFSDIVNNYDIIVCDRYTTSNAIYQGAKIIDGNIKEYLDWLYDFEFNKLKLPLPDITVYLKMPVDTSQELLKKRYNNEEKRDIHEKNIPFLKNCEKVADHLCKNLSWHTVDCLDSNNKIKSIDKINNEIFYIVSNLI